MINVTKTFLPPIEEYQRYLSDIWQRAWVTNNGPVLQELELALKNKLKVENLWFTSNGTVPLQLAIKALEFNDAEIITTPFSYVATCNSILWENCKPIFVDINSQDFCIDTTKIESKITKNTKAILATHVYGFPCDVETIEALAKKHNLTVIYDAAHAFGVEYNGKSLLSYGDISTCSFHATKVFHTIEGGCIILKNSILSEKVYWQRQFGHKNDDYKYVGINGKNSEMHAAMGLAVLPYFDKIVASRKLISEKYNQLLDWSNLTKPQTDKDIKYNYAYYPVVFQTENQLLTVFEMLKAENIVPRRYFYPSLNTLSFIAYQACPISEELSKRVLCLPLYYDLEIEIVEKIASIINSNT